MDDGTSIGMLTFFNEAIGQAMNAECASNAMSWACSQVFRECEEITTREGERVWAPTLTCRDDCEAFMTTWEKCVDELSSDASSLEKFETLMRQMVRSMFWMLCPEGCFSDQHFPCPFIL